MHITIFEGRPLNRRLALYLADRDRHGNPVRDFAGWADEGARVLATVAGGVTRLPVSRGYWLSHANGKLIYEATEILFSFVEPAALRQRFRVFSDFVCRYGIEANQEAVAIEYDGSLHFVTDFANQPAVHAYH